MKKIIISIALLIYSFPLLAQQKMNSYWSFPAISTPGNPISGWYYMYMKTGVGLCFLASDGTETCPSGTGGGGVTTMTTGAVDPTANCVAPSISNLAKYYNTATKTLWTCVNTNTWHRDIDVDPAVAWLLVGNTGTAPATPSVGTVALYSVAGELSAKDSSGNVTTTETTNQKYRDIVFLFDAAGVALTGPATRCRVVSFGGTIDQYTAVADTSGSATVTISTSSYAGYTSPTGGTDISNGGEALSSAIKMQDSVLTGWTPALSPGTVVCGTLSSPSSVSWLQATLRVKAN